MEPLTEQQLLAINNLQQSSQQAEDALSQGMEALQQSLAETLAGSLGPSGSSGNVANYMGQMAMAMGKLGTLEGFIRQVSPRRKEWNLTFKWFSLLVFIKVFIMALIHDLPRLCCVTGVNSETMIYSKNYKIVHWQILR